MFDSLNITIQYRKVLNAQQKIKQNPQGIDSSKSKEYKVNEVESKEQIQNTGRVF